MNKNEIALQLTLKAMEDKTLRLLDTRYEDKDKCIKQNADNAQMISEFYNKIINAIENEVQVHSKPF